MDLTMPTLSLAEFYTITTATGDVARFTSHDQDITYEGSLYQAIPIMRSQISYHSDLQVDKVDISMGLVGVVIGTNEYSIPRLIQLGLFRNAHVVISLYDFVAGGTWKVLFEGWCTEGISYNKGICTMSIGSLLDKLNEKFPKYIYSDYCNHQLYGSYCGLTKTDWQVMSAAEEGSTKAIIVSPVFLFSAHAGGWWMKGEIKMTSGANANVSRSIISHSDQYVIVLIPFVEEIVPGDTFTVWAGCDKSGIMCDEKFSNYANFFGFEYTPKPEVLLG